MAGDATEQPVDPFQAIHDAAAAKAAERRASFDSTTATIHRAQKLREGEKLTFERPAPDLKIVPTE
jgi:hypothetical protein